MLLSFQAAAPSRSGPLLIRTVMGRSTGNVEYLLSFKGTCHISVHLVFWFDVVDTSYMSTLFRGVFNPRVVSQSVSQSVSHLFARVVVTS